MENFKSLSYLSHHNRRKSFNRQVISAPICSQPPYTSVTNFPIGNHTKSSINILPFIKLRQQKKKCRVQKKRGGGMVRYMKTNQLFRLHSVRTNMTIILSTLWHTITSRSSYATHWYSLTGIFTPWHLRRSYPCNTETVKVNFQKLCSIY